MIRSIGDLLPGLLRDLGLDDALQGWRAVADWRRVVGERLARRTRALRWSEGKLWVEVDGAVWMHELSLLRRDLIAELNRHLGAERVKELVFVLPRGGSLR